MKIFLVTWPGSGRDWPDVCCEGGHHVRTRAQAAAARPRHRLKLDHGGRQGAAPAPARGYSAAGGKILNRDIWVYEQKYLSARVNIFDYERENITWTGGGGGATRPPAAGGRASPAESHDQCPHRSTPCRPDHPPGHKIIYVREKYLSMWHVSNNICQHVNTGSRQKKSLDWNIWVLLKWSIGILDTWL